MPSAKQSMPKQLPFANPRDQARPQTGMDLEDEIEDDDEGLLLPHMRFTGVSQVSDVTSPSPPRQPYNEGPLPPLILSTPSVEPEFLAGKPKTSPFKFTEDPDTSIAVQQVRFPFSSSPAAPIASNKFVESLPTEANETPIADLGNPNTSFDQPDPGITSDDARLPGLDLGSSSPMIFTPNWRRSAQAHLPSASPPTAITVHPKSGPSGSSDLPNIFSQTQPELPQSQTQLEHHYSPTHHGHPVSPTQLEHSMSPTQLEHPMSPTQHERPVSPTQLEHSEISFSQSQLDRDLAFSQTQIEYPNPSSIHSQAFHSFQSPSSLRRSQAQGRTSGPILETDAESYQHFLHLGENDTGHDHSQAQLELFASSSSVSLREGTHVKARDDVISKNTGNLLKSSHLNGSSQGETESHRMGVVPTSEPVAAAASPTSPSRIDVNHPVPGKSVPQDKSHSSQSSSDEDPRMRVFVKYAADKNFYPGTVIHAGDKSVRVAYDYDGSEQNFPRSALKRCQLYKGDLISVPGIGKSSKDFDELAVKRSTEILRSSDIVHCTDKNGKARNVSVSDIVITWVHKDILKDRSWERKRDKSQEDKTDKTRKRVKVSSDETFKPAAPPRQHLTLPSPTREALSQPKSNVPKSMLEGKAFVITTPSQGMQERQSLVTQIQNAGGTVVDFDKSLFSVKMAWPSHKVSLEFGDLSFDTVLLLSDGPRTSPKYLRALALGIPCVHFAYIDACYKERCTLDFFPFMLPAGTSTLVGSPIMGAMARVAQHNVFSMRELRMRFPNQAVFREARFILAGVDPPKDGDKLASEIEERCNILVYAGAARIILAKSWNDVKDHLSKVDDAFVIKMGPTSPPRNFVSAYPFDWVKECLIQGRILP